MVSRNSSLRGNGEVWGLDKILGREAELEVCAKSRECIRSIRVNQYKAIISLAHKMRTRISANELGELVQIDVAARDDRYYLF